MKKIILIGGSPTAGKSYTARKIAEELKLPWISTDTIREQMRKIVRKEDYPRLFDHAESGSLLAEEYLTKNSAKEIVAHQNKESEEVWKGVKALIETDYVWESFIIEGVAILPQLVNKLNVKDKEIISIFLIDSNKDRIRKTIFTRGLWDDADKYSNKLKEKEVDWVIEFNKFLQSETKKHGLKVLDIGNQKDYLKEIKNILEK